MKIRFIKEFRGPGFITKVGETANSKDAVKPAEAREWYKWLIDAGFAKEIGESGWWKPQKGDTYYVTNYDGCVTTNTWDGCAIDLARHKRGECFKTERAADRWSGYLKAVATVRQDEGVLTPAQTWKHGQDDYLYYVYATRSGNLDVFWLDIDDDFIPVNAIYFDSKNAALASLNKHRSEWEMIANYDWSRG